MAATGSLESAAVTAEGRAPDGIAAGLLREQPGRTTWPRASTTRAWRRASWRRPTTPAGRGRCWETLGSRTRAPAGRPPYLRAVRHVQEVLFLPQRQPGTLDNAAVKWAVMTYGGVDAALRSSDTQAEDRYWNAATSSYYSDTARRARTTTSSAWAGTTRTRPATSCPAAGRPATGRSSSRTAGDRTGRLGRQDEGVLLGLILRRELRQGARGVQRRRVRGRLRRDLPVRRARPQRWISAGGGERRGTRTASPAPGRATVAAVSFYTPVPGTAYEVRVARHAAGHRRGAGRRDRRRRRRRVPHRSASSSRPSWTAGDASSWSRCASTTPGWRRTRCPWSAPSDLIAPRARAGQSFVSADGSSWTDLTALGTLPGASRANVCLKAFVNAAGAGDTRPPRVELRGGIVAPRSHGDDPLAARRPGLLQRQRDRRAQRARRRAARSWPERRIPGRRRRRARGLEPEGGLAGRAGTACRGRAYDVAGGRQETATRAAVVVRGVAPAVAAASRGRRPGAS